MLSAKSITSLVFLSAALSLTRTPSVAPVVQEAPARELTAFGDLSAHPGQALGQRVEFSVTFHRWVETWDPYLTRFGQEDYACFEGWSDEQYPWRESDFDFPAVRVFFKRDSEALRSIRDAKTWNRFTVEATVHQYFAGMPWLEVLGVEEERAALNEGCVIHATRALDEMSKEQFEIAVQELDRALVGVLPLNAKGELLRLKGQAIALQRSSEETN